LDNQSESKLVGEVLEEQLSEAAHMIAFLLLSLGNARDGGSGGGVMGGMSWLDST